FFELLETRAAIDAGAFEPVRLGSDEARRLVRLGVEVLYDDAVAAQRQVQHVTGLPVMLDAIEYGVALALQDDDHLAALELEPARAAAGRDLLLEEHEHRQHGVLDGRVQVPAHQALAVALERQLRLL